MARKPTHISTESAIDRLRAVAKTLVDAVKNNSDRDDGQDEAIEGLKQEVEAIKNDLPFSVKDFEDLERAAAKIQVSE